MNRTDKVLRELQLTELEILKYVDGICRKYDLKYSLYAGTLLGAVRHKGFIPWDDDIDICMPRDDYNRFIELWPQVASDAYVMQNKDNTPDYTQNFTKIRKKDSEFYTVLDIGRNYNTGIFLDIFPVDRVSVNGVTKWWFYFKIMLLHLMTREFIPKKNGAAMKTVCNMILKLIPASKRAGLRKTLLKSLTKHNGDHTLPVAMLETTASMKQIFDSSLLDEYVELPFEDQTFCCFAKWEYFLTHKYGDYLQLPPESERVWKHRPLRVNFTGNSDNEG